MDMRSRERRLTSISRHSLIRCRLKNGKPRSISRSGKSDRDRILSWNRISLGRYELPGDFFVLMKCFYRLTDNKNLCTRGMNHHPLLSFCFQGFPCRSRSEIISKLPYSGWNEGFFIPSKYRRSRLHLNHHEREQTHLIRNSQTLQPTYRKPDMH